MEEQKEVNKEEENPPEKGKEEEKKNDELIANLVEIKEKKEEEIDIKILGNIQLKEKEKLEKMEQKIEELKEEEIKNIKLIPKKDYIIVVVYNITPNVTENHLKEIFSNYGEVRGVYIPKKEKTHLKENYAFIEFIKKEEAEEAQLYMDEGQIDGRVVKVEILNPKNYIRIN